MYFSNTFCLFSARAFSESLDAWPQVRNIKVQLRLNLRSYKCSFKIYIFQHKSRMYCRTINDSKHPVGKCNLLKMSSLKFIENNPHFRHRSY